MAKVTAKSLEQRLLAKGYTQAEIDEIKPALSSQKFRNDLEADLNAAEQAMSDLGDYDKWFTDEITPEHQALIKRAEDAEAEAAAAKARMAFYQKKGMDKQADVQLREEADRISEDARRAQGQKKGGDVDLSKYVSNDTFQNAFERTGDAIADAQDLVTDFMQLYPGQRLSLKQMREEAKAAKMPIRAYVERKYDFEGKRKAQADADIEKRIQAAVAAKEAELVVKLGGSNPNLQIGTQSTNPFVARKTANKETKQPWENNENQNARDRVEKAIQKAAARGDLARA